MADVTKKAGAGARYAAHGALQGGKQAAEGAMSTSKLILDALGRAGRNNISIVAGGVAFYVFLAMVPLLLASVLIYGLVASPQTVAQNIGQLAQVMPDAAAQIFGEQLTSVVETSGGKKGVGLIVALVVALFGARNGAGSILTALNISHGVAEQRGIVMANVVAIGITAGGIFAVILAVLAMGVLTTLINLLPVGTALIGTLATYAFLFAIGMGGAATLFRYAPNRPAPGWKVVLPGAVFCAIGWFLLTLGFGIYVANFANYNATYGSLSAVVVLLTWLYFSAFVLLMGAEINAAWGDRREGYKGLEVG